MKRAILIHGWGGRPDAGWLWWLKNELEALGFQVEAPQMPDTLRPISEKWMRQIATTVGSPDKNVFLVGYSLGVIAILRYLESLDPDQKVGGVVLVAGFSEPIGVDQLGTFFRKPTDYKKIKSAAGKIIAVHSNNDPIVPLMYGELMEERLEAELIVMKNAGHFRPEDGFSEIPVVLDQLVEISA